MFNPGMILFVLLEMASIFISLIFGIPWFVMAVRGKEAVVFKRWKSVRILAALATLIALIYSYSFLFAGAYRNDIAIYASLWWLIIFVPLMSIKHPLSGVAFLSSGIFLLMVLSLATAMELQREVDEAMEHQAIDRAHAR